MEAGTPVIGQSVYCVFPSGLIVVVINLKWDPGIKNKLCKRNIHGALCILRIVKFKLIGAKVSFTEYQCGSGWLDRNGDFTSRLVRLISA